MFTNFELFMKPMLMCIDFLPIFYHFQIKLDDFNCWCISLSILRLTRTLFTRSLQLIGVSQLLPYNSFIGLILLDSGYPLLYENSTSGRYSSHFLGWCITDILKMASRILFVLFVFPHVCEWYVTLNVNSVPKPSNYSFQNIKNELSISV